MKVDSGISVVLPNFNHARYLEHALRNLLAQSPPPAEIIVVDDASTDESVPLIERIAAETPLVKLIVNPENVGTIRAQQRGLERASGRYIYLAAADDWVLPGFFSLAVDMLERHPASGLFCADAMLVEAASGRQIGYRPIVRPFYRARAADAEEARRILLRIDNWILTGSALLRRDAIEQAGGLDESFGSVADGYLARKIALIRGFCYAPQVVAAWRISAGSVSRQTSLSPEKATAVLDTIPPRLAADPVFPPDYPELFRRRWQFATSRLALQVDPINYDIVEAMNAGSSLDARLLRQLRRLPFPRLQRFAALAWLSLRLRPFPLSALIATRLSRAMARPLPASSAEHTLG